MKRTASVIALVLMGFLAVASDVRGGAGGLILPTKTTGPTLTATVVIDVTGGMNNPGKGAAAIRVQKGLPVFQAAKIHATHAKTTSPVS